MPYLCGIEKEKGNKQTDIAMIKTVRIEKEFDIVTAECQVFARYWEDSEVDGVADDTREPKMPCVRLLKLSPDHRVQMAWCPVIDLDRGCIVNWPVGCVAKIHYKSCDENRVVLRDRHGEVIKEYNGYVPDILDPHREGDGDYVVMEIDSNGYIADFDNDIDDILNSED